ncbi:cysteine-rich CWC family protein [Bacillus taeanensis]|uniref:Cysteine-rich CWC family protein n=1 Tax=Bacillus taeanensis TaxID=273032 RepID=A0A366XPR0_9BACI|nr:cysteine-rich CWC family protein [Bacillus taeanensis]RBW68350.1 hypothetical protein DS031_16930 [Bacillus taeanensis]
MANKYCPLCGKDNECRTGAGEHGHCWCDLETFPKEIFELVPVESRRKHCICKNCLIMYKAEKKINNNK